MDKLDALLADRILVLDGAMGTELQARGMRGNAEEWNLSNPEEVRAVHEGYFEAGADAVETNTFSATAIGQIEFGLEKRVVEINEAAARLAREAADAWTARTPDQPRFVFGSVGPTNRTASMSPKVEDPGFREVDFQGLATAYREQIVGLLNGGVDALLIETVFDTLNAKAAIWAALEEQEARGSRIPLLISGTITDRAGRTLSGQTAEAFWTSIRHAQPLAVGFNCALGAAEMRPHLEEVASLAESGILAYPNAGLPDEFGEYQQTPEEMAAAIGEWADSGLLNIIGGCCGTTPAHIAALVEAVRGKAPRQAAKRAHKPDSERPRFSGLEPLVIRPESNLINIGERTNVSGSRKFARLVKEDAWEEALVIARDQVEDGAQMIDVCMDEGLLDGPAAMTRFLRLLASEPDIARVPVVVDSSRFEVLEVGLENLQGKALVNSLSLKDGEEEFRRRATLCRRHGAAIVVMAFDEQGQADNVERRLEIVQRSHRILHDEIGFPETDLVFDLNILAVATGIAEHDRYAADFLIALKQLKEEFPKCLFSGGLSNLSFAFRGLDRVRQALHAVFLFHAREAGLDMAILHPAHLAILDDLDPELRELAEDVVFAQRPDAGDRLLACADALRRGGDGEVDGKEDDGSRNEWRELPVAERLAHALIHGMDAHVETDCEEALTKAEGDALAVIEGVLMTGMNRVGDLFGAGKMFLPQVVKSARVMKKAVAWLEPYLKDGKQADSIRQCVVMATVKGDVHDIGKNIVGVVLGCGGWAVQDLGVMVHAQDILAAAKNPQVKAIGLSGLITPSLDEMVHVAQEMERTGVNLPLLIGGATTSPAHTAARIAPAYSQAVVHVADASRVAGVLSQLTSKEGGAAYLTKLREKQDVLRKKVAQRKTKPKLSVEQARARKLQFNWEEASAPPPSFLGVRPFATWDLANLIPFIDWTPFFSTWEMKGKYPAILKEPAAADLHREALALLDQIVQDSSLQAEAVLGFFPASSQDDTVIVQPKDGPEIRFDFPRQRGKTDDDRARLCLADFIAPSESDLSDHLGMFAVTAGKGCDALAAQFEADDDDYRALLAKSLADRLAEAFAERLHHKVRTEFWGYAPEESLDSTDLIAEKYRGIRPAPGYPACPEHALKDSIFDLLDVRKHTSLRMTESRAVTPAASVCGFYFAHPEARYFGVGPA